MIEAENTPFQYDASVKQLIEGAAPMMVRKFLGITGKMEVIPLDTELPITIFKSADCILRHTDDNGNVQYIHVEFQTDYDKEMSLRMLFYFLLIWIKYEQPPTQLLLHLSQRKRDYHTKIDIPDRLWFEFPAVYITEEPLEAFLEANTPEATILGVLAYYPDAEEKGRLIIEHLQQQGLSKNRFFDYLAIGETLAQINDFKETLQKIRSKMGFHLDIKQSGIYQEAKAAGLSEGLLLGKEQGKAEGKAEGKVQGKAEGIIEIAVNLYKEGFDLKQIRNLTKMTDELWDQFLKQLN